MKKTVSISLLVLLSVVSVSRAQEPAAPVSNLRNAAINLFLVDQPNADLINPRNLKEISSIESELTALYDVALTEEGRKAFRVGLPWVEGQLLFSVSGKALDSLESVFEGVAAEAEDTKKYIDLTKTRLPDTDLDYRLFKLGIRSISRSAYSPLYVLYFDKKINPQRMSEEVKRAGIDTIRSADPDWMANLLIGNKISRFELRPREFIYVLTAAWGDCMAGCGYQHHRFYLVDQRWDDSYTVKFLYAMGADISGSEEASGYFKETTVFSEQAPAR